ncbi:MAG: hypothetical protein ABI639_14480 [Thermoanaerobaculia bacterium]
MRLHFSRLPMDNESEERYVAECRGYRLIVRPDGMLYRVAIFGPPLPGTVIWRLLDHAKAASLSAAKGMAVHLLLGQPRLQVAS